MVKALATVADIHAHSGLIVRMFRTALARAPEPAALQAFSELLRNGGSAEEVARAVIGSVEFQLLHGKQESCDPDFVTRLFHSGLGRLPEPDAVAHFGQMGSRLAVLMAIATSPEAVEKVDLLEDLFPEGVGPADPLGYKLWVERYDTLEEEDVAAIGQQVDALASVPTISLLMAAKPGRPDLLLETLRSLDDQLYPHWTLHVACPPDLPAAPRRALEEASRRVPGLNLVSLPAGSEAGPADLMQAAFEHARGSFVAFLEPGDRLSRSALYEIALALEATPGLQLLYTDEDSLDEAGERFEPVFKPGWSPDMLLNGDMVGQLAVIRRDRVLEAGGVRGEAGALARFDLLLRVTDGLPADAIRHIPSVLFHRGRQPGQPLPFPRSRNSSVHPDVERTVQRHLRERGSALSVSDTYIAGGVWPRVDYPLPAILPRVSVLIPTCDQPELLEACLEGLLERTDYPDIEILVADNGSRTGEGRQMLRRLKRNPRLRVFEDPEPFNWSRLNNRLAAEATGEVLVLLNDDTEVVGRDWLRELVRQVSRPGVGIAGARLLYPDESLQHGGVVLDDLGATHVLRSAREEEPGYMGQLAMVRDLSAVTGACLAVRRETLDAVGGLDEAFPLACNDIDLCLRARRAGWRVVWTPHAVLQHVDGASRGHDRKVGEIGRAWRDLRRLHDRWGDAMDADPFLNANLEASDHDLLLANPPRRDKPWQRLRDELFPDET
ncbi:glycosyltransferase [Rhizosaccharibacter radicis]|uniref:Glycosyltransferase n=1 Tax=Rhizosaccharibacter radicis TaxID=2782605 RepID=A0ABT1VT70_9PROT|nr:glycosyltransferase [Acetobacteraceae bacterium KSS12]